MTPAEKKVHLYDATTIKVLEGITAVRHAVSKADSRTLLSLPSSGAYRSFTLISMPSPPVSPRTSTDIATKPLKSRKPGRGICLVGTPTVMKNAPQS